MPRRFQQVDVFTSVAYRGNPVAVVLDGEGLDDEQLPRFSSWTNLSETTFVLPPPTHAADYRVRIFSLQRELPFAGHPTLGTCHAWLEAGGSPSGDDVIQECGAGLVRVRRGERLAVAAPPLGGPRGRPPPAADPLRPGRRARRPTRRRRPVDRPRGHPRRRLGRQRP